jgi:hypothetical protein
MIYGIYRDVAGRAVERLYVEPNCTVPVRVGCIVEQIGTEAQLLAIELEPEPEKLINQKIRQIAIDALIAEGQLPADYKGS